MGLINYKIRENKAITLISLVITVAVLMIITSTIAININTRYESQNLDKLSSDLKLLNDKVLLYYTENGEYPITGEKISVGDTEYPEGVDDNIYKIDLSKLSGLTLNYGEGDGEEDKDIFTINTSNGVISYRKGIEYNGEKYHYIIGNNDVTPQPVLKISKTTVDALDESGTTRKSMTVTANNRSFNIKQENTVVFTVETNQKESVSYQWFRNESAITGATNNTYIVSKINDGDIYYCKVTYDDIPKETTKVKLIIDNTTIVKYPSAPIITVDVYLGGMEEDDKVEFIPTDWYGEDYNIELWLSVEDEGAGEVTYQVSTDKINWTTEGINKSADAYEIPEVFDGILYFRAKDKDGNVSEVSQVEIHRDCKAPTVEIAVNYTGIENGNEITVYEEAFLEFEGIDDNFHTYTYTIKKNGENIETEEITMYESLPVTKELEEVGEYEITATCIDYAGNETTKKITVIVLPGLSAPTIEVIDNNSTDDFTYDETKWYNSNNDLEINLSVEGVGAGGVTYQWKIDESIWFTGGIIDNKDNTACFWAVPQYEGTLYFKAVDSKGTESDISSINIKYDKTLPTVAISLSGSEIETGIYNSDVYVTFTATDEIISGIKEMRYSIKETGAGESITSGDTIELTEAGSYTITLTATDEAGNEDTLTKDITINLAIEKLKIKNSWGSIEQGSDKNWTSSILQTFNNGSSADEYKEVSCGYTLVAIDSDGNEMNIPDGTIINSTIELLGGAYTGYTNSSGTYLRNLRGDWYMNINGIQKYSHTYSRMNNSSGPAGYNGTAQHLSTTSSGRLSIGVLEGPSNIDMEFKDNKIQLESRGVWNALEWSWTNFVYDSQIGVGFKLSNINFNGQACQVEQ